MNYGFCFAGNRYESYPINLRLDLQMTRDPLKQMVDFTFEDPNV